ncbi:membrane protein (plasmid) [Fulvitalea axinellae]|uniref:Membrane protein n=1 Tax=Fulvitalea axinellae TaxID=1182444 RepID=A0AAU9DLB7_9BACT|nr:membrane protein [Fulvitalea axinellae]
MRKTKYMFLALAMLLGASCTSWLEIGPENDIVLEDYWKSKEDIESAVFAAYGGLARQQTKMFEWGELRGDALEATTETDEDAQKAMRLEIFPESEFAKWDGFYKTINRANTVLKYGPTVQDYDESLTDEDLGALMGEAYFLRALSYFYLVRSFGEVPMPLLPSDTDKQDIYLEKSSEQAVVNQIIDDLTKAEKIISDDYGKLEENKGRGTKSAVRALLADVYMWAENYPKAILYCDKIFNRAAHGLLPGERWFDIFAKGNTNEGIYELQTDREVAQQTLRYQKTLVPVGNTRFKASSALKKLFNQADIRGEEVSYRGDGAGGIAGNIWKYMGLTTAKESVVRVRNVGDEELANWIVYRLADIILLKAEALIQTGDFLGAQRLINNVRQRAGLGALILPTDKAEAEDKLLEERAREFAFEGKRWFDMLRVAKRNEYARKDLLIEILTENVSPSQLPIWKSKLSDPLSYYWPLPRVEVENNQNLKQNPYYEQTAR